MRDLKLREGGERYEYKVTVGEAGGFCKKTGQERVWIKG